MHVHRVRLASKVAYVRVVPERRYTNPKLAIPEDNLAKLSNRDFGLYFYNSVDISGIRLLGESALLRSISDRLTFMTPKDLYRVLIGLARCDVVLNQHILQLIHSKLVRDVAQLRVHEVCLLAVQIAAASKRTAQRSPHGQSVVMLLASTFSKKIAAANPNDLANLAIAVVDMDIIDPVLMARIAEATNLQIGLCRGPELADIVTAFSMINFPLHIPVVVQ